MRIFWPPSPNFVRSIVQSFAQNQVLQSPVIENKAFESKNEKNEDFQQIEFELNSVST
jgi:hypothetical protein